MYIACGYTDMRLEIDGLAAIVKQQFSGSLYQHVFLVLRQTAGPNQGNLLEERWICVTVQTNGIRFFPVTTKRKRS